MLLVLDVGNTNTTLGVYEGHELKHSWRLTSERHRTVDEYGIMCRTLLQLAGLESSVHLRHCRLFSRAYARLHFEQDGGSLLWTQAVVHHKRQRRDACALQTTRARSGADRVVNAVAGVREIRQPVHRRRLRHGDNLRCHLEGRASILAE